jgi:arsenate reductase-like glutaredoxin family protein
VFFVGGFFTKMDFKGHIPRVYTLPDCPKCDELKEWFEAQGYQYDVRSFDTEIQLDFIMRNMFGSPPILEVRSEVFSSEELFHKELLDEGKLLEVLMSA